MKNKTHQVAVKTKNNKVVIDLGKVSIGHQLHSQGCGKHDSRPKRLRTRQSQRQKWTKEY